MQDRVSGHARSSAGIRGARAALPIRFAGVSFTAGTARILERIDLELSPGAPTLLMGPNGAGKTTLLRLAMGLIVPTSGSIAFGDHDQAEPGSRAMVFQRPVMLRRTVAENVAFALCVAGRSADVDGIERLLDLAHIRHLACRPARRLSGGEQKCLALARALARCPQVLFLDEPTASLDPASTKLVEDIIANVAGSGVKIVMSSHDLGQARRLAREVVFLAGGHLVEQTPASSFFTNPATEAARRFIGGELVI